MASGVRDGGIGLGDDVPSPAGFDRELHRGRFGRGSNVEHGDPASR